MGKAPQQRPSNGLHIAYPAYNYQENSYPIPTRSALALPTPDFFTSYWSGVDMQDQAPLPNPRRIIIRVQ